MIFEAQLMVFFSSLLFSFPVQWSPCHNFSNSLPYPCQWLFSIFSRRSHLQKESQWSSRDSRRFQKFSLLFFVKHPVAALYILLIMFWQWIILSKGCLFIWFHLILIFIREKWRELSKNDRNFLSLNQYLSQC